MFVSRYLGWLAASLAATSDVPAPRRHPRAVMGFATGYPAAALEPFVRSLRDRFDGEIILAVDDNPDIRAFLDAYQVTAVTPVQPPEWSPHPVMERFAAYDAWIRSRPWLTQVLLTDVRDVIFRATPSPDPPESWRSMSSARATRWPNTPSTGSTSPPSSARSWRPG